MASKNYAYVNNNMLVWARANTPFETTIDVQSALKIDAAKIDEWENGTEFPSISEAKKLAKLYKVPFATFFMSEPPKAEPRPYTDRRTYNGTVYREMSYELWAEIGRVIGNREKMIEVLDENDMDSDYESLPLLEPNTSVGDIANSIRTFLGVSLPFKNKNAYKNSYNFYRAVLESKGVFIAQITGISLEEMKGISIYYEKFPIIAINNKDYERAKTFSLIHEMAHLIRRSSSLCLIDFNERNDDEEKICDRIAAEVLMPTEEFKVVTESFYKTHTSWSEECLSRIADKFGVSIFSVIRRLHDLNIISKSYYLSLYKEFSDKFEERQVEIDAHKEGRSLIIPYHTKYLNKEGYLYTKTIMTSYSKGNISYGEMCHILNVASTHIAKMERAVMFV